MTDRYRAALIAASMVFGVALASGGASAATVSPLSPLQPLTVTDGGGVELASYPGWGRRCYRDCFIGRHGRTYCTWKCYRPRRWW